MTEKILMDKFPYGCTYIEFIDFFDTYINRPALSQSENSLKREPISPPIEDENGCIKNNPVLRMNRLVRHKSYCPSYVISSPPK